MFLERSGCTAILDASSALTRTYSELADDVEQTASAIDSPHKSLVFNFCRNDYDALRGYLAGLHSRNAVALLDDGMVAGFREALIELYQPEYLAHSRSARMKISDHYQLTDESGPVVWRRKIPAESEIHPETAVLLSTSGSTGTPKFVRLTAGNLLANAQSIVHGLGIQAQDRAITSLPFHYSYGLSVVNTHLLTGASLVLTNESITARPFWNSIRDLSCTSLAGVPSSYQILNRLRLPGEGFPSLTTLTQAGGKLQPELIEKFHRAMQARGGRFYVMYGQTEATARIAILDPQWLPEKLGSAGRAILNGALTAGSNGEVVYSGPNVMLGYATSRADLAKGDEMNSILPTGDLGRIDRDGFLFVTGRSNRFAKLSGVRFNLDELETMLKDYGPAAVIEQGDRLVVFCESEDLMDLDPWRREFARRLSVHHTLLDFRRISSLPLKTTGKVDYRVLEQAAQC